MKLTKLLKEIKLVKNKIDAAFFGNMIYFEVESISFKGDIDKNNSNYYVESYSIGIDNKIKLDTLEEYLKQNNIVYHRDFDNNYYISIPKIYFKRINNK
jgi:hypothetical protein